MTKNTLQKSPSASSLHTLLVTAELKHIYNYACTFIVAVFYVLKLVTLCAFLPVHWIMCIDEHGKRAIEMSDGFALLTMLYVGFVIGRLCEQARRKRLATKRRQAREKKQKL